MDRLNEALNGSKVTTSDRYLPEFFRCGKEADREGLFELLARSPDIRVFDNIEMQLQELMRSLCPSRKFSKEELADEARSHLGGTPSNEYGVWVHYPWSKCVVHLLDEDEFAVVRTDRNRNKITPEEQLVLASKKVGIIGLSVGQSVSITMALERSFGEIRLADFDSLELSNLNRIRSGVHCMGVNKAVNVAREIAEIDPFLKVICYTEGITKENIGRFLIEGGELDILVEECDSIDIKIIARQKAKELRIPVVMDTSDRGLIDVERFDIEPDRPILHGLVEDMDLTQLDGPMTNQQKLPYLSKMVGLDDISDRLRDCLPEIGRTLVTWPQIASEVILGGSLVAEICRKIAIGMKIPSGRWWFDTQKFITNGSSENGSVVVGNKRPSHGH